MDIYEKDTLSLTTLPGPAAERKVGVYPPPINI